VSVERGENCENGTGLLFALKGNVPFS